MNDTVKLIVTISRDQYEIRKNALKNVNRNIPITECEFAIATGTPLDDVKAKIEQKARPYEIGGRGNGKSIRYGLCMALQILDNIGKAEREEN